MYCSVRSIFMIAVLLATPLVATSGETGGKTAQVPPTLSGLNEKLLSDPKASDAAADLLEAAYQGKPQPENIRMLLSILRGRMGANEGWFGPSQTRYTWNWLADSHGIDPAKQKIARKAFRGNDAEFIRLDRDRDDVLSAADLDWTDDSPVTKAAQQAKALFDSIDDGDGKVTPEEWNKFMKKLAGNRGFLTQDDLIPLFMLKKASPAAKAKKDAQMPPKLKQMILKGFFDGDVGSWCEGPQLGEPAPDFTLPTPEGKKSITLSHSLGKKPIVLIFGSFT